MNDSLYIYAARYAHKRKTGAALQVVSAIVGEWDNISDTAKKQLFTESFEATYNSDDWEILRDKYANRK